MLKLPAHKAKQSLILCHLNKLPVRHRRQMCSDKIQNTVAKINKCLRRELGHAASLMTS